MAEFTRIRETINNLKNQCNKIENETKLNTTPITDQTIIQQQVETQEQTIKLQFQGKPSWITGMVILPSGKLLLVDNKNEALSIFSVSFDFLITKHIHPAPYDVASISSTQDRVMLSVPSTQELMRCDVLLDNAFSVGRKLKISIACKAVASDERYVAVCSDSELQIFEAEADTLSIILDESYETTGFTYIAMNSSERKIFITDQTICDPHINCFNFNGETLWKINDGRLNKCTGICAIGTQLMFTSWESGQMFTLSSNGGDLKMTKHSVRFPWKLYISERQNKICVSQYNSTLAEEEKRTVKAFTMI
ncbi:uncharacterized protein LOC132555855 [Ylistrum balloti]|uniref:uncharacterized protein LOC132555855 n=1 Tax=Ylistrum balloti TaxID=509963 RepID=UPI002905C600|nr:uncharacterized protein LOC132555855 [Ylistrum balloti]